MLLIRCPHCGPRPELEFRYGGEAHIARAPTPSAIGADEWGAYLYQRSNPRGVHAERWRHIHGCARFFNALRDTRTDRILETYEMGRPRPDGGSEENLPPLSGDNFGTWSGETAR